MNSYKSFNKLFVIVLVFFTINIVFGQFKTSRQKELESILMAPCCGGGTMAEHDDNQHTLNMKMAINALTMDEYNEKNIISLFETTYSNPGIYRLGFSPATKPVRQVIDHVKRTIHPNMSLAEIVDIFAWIHSPTIRSAPPETGIHTLAWKMPLIVLVIGTIIIIFVIKAYINKPEPVKVGADGKKTDTSLENRIEKEMKELEI